MKMISTDHVFGYYPFGDEWDVGGFTAGVFNPKDVYDIEEEDLEDQPVYFDIVDPSTKCQFIFSSRKVTT